MESEAVLYPDPQPFSTYMEPPHFVGQETDAQSRPDLPKAAQPGAELGLKATDLMATPTSLGLFWLPWCQC